VGILGGCAARDEAAPGRIYPHHAGMLAIGEAAFSAGAGSAVEIAVRVGLWLTGAISHPRRMISRGA
jgi:hypothetical protein